MPQMFPLLWLSLFFNLTVSIILALTLVHFLFSMTWTKGMKSMPTTNNPIWKW